MTDSPYRIAPPGFTDEKWETFERDGILFFEDALDTDAIDELSAAMDRVCQQSLLVGYRLRTVSGHKNQRQIPRQEQPLVNDPGRHPWRS